MKIALTLLCRNERDIIGHNIEFHLSQGVDFIIVTDNASDDDSAAIIQRYVASGRVELLHEPQLTHDQSTWVSDMARRAARRGADWVINSDADEFWWAAGGSLRTVLSAVPASVFAVAAQRHNFPPVRGGPAHFASRMIYRESPSFNGLGVPLPAKIIHRAGMDVVVFDGNHAISLAGRRMPAQPTESIDILHYPMRTFEQYQRKIVLGAQALERNTRIGPDVGEAWRYHYHELYEKGLLLDYYRENELTTDKIARRMADQALFIDTRLREFVELSQVPA